MPAHLAVTSGAPPRVFVLEKGTLVAGRSVDAGIELPHVEISRNHCRFIWDGETCAVEDLGSVRGTRVNGERISALTALSPGDTVAVGPVLMQFDLGEPPHVEVAQGSERAAVPAMLVQGQPVDRIATNAPVVIGRDAQADVVLNDPGVSRRHASLRPVPGGGCVVTDLHSSAGSFVNGQRFDEHELTVGDRLQIGPFVFQFDGQALARVANAAGGCLRTGHLFFRSGEQVILDDVTLLVPPSRFVGILGPSGAGKSSLLHALAGLRPPSSGTVLADDIDIYATNQAQSFGYVPQEDIVHPELTVSEGLRFSARLRLPRQTPQLEIQKLIVQTMDQLGLRERADLPVHRLSGGQRKRVSVGVELLAKPSILFLDEPSSGLDPATEFQLMELLRELADTGCTIVCTTHVLENAYLFDEMIVLVGGCLAFQGSPQQARDYFSVQKLTGLYDRLLERPAKDWQAAFAETAASRASEKTIAGTAAPTADVPKRRFPLAILLERQWAILRADWRNFALLVGQPLVIALLVSWVSNDRSMILFFAYLSTLWFGCSNAAQEIVKEIAIFRRERLVGVGVHSYLTSKFLFLTAITAVQCLVLYGAILLCEGGREGTASWQILALLGTSLAAVGIGSAISALARSLMQAVMIVPLILIPQILFSGFTVAANEMGKSVFTVSRLMPTFSAQTLMDTSFIWKQRIARDVLDAHWTSFRNLNRKNDIKMNTIYERSGPAVRALAGHLAWAAGSYIVAALALRRRQE